MPYLHRVLPTALILSATLAGAPLSVACAQIVDGIVLDSIGGQPVGYGFVILRSTAGVELARTLVGYEGRFHVTAPGPGVYRLQSARIGYRTVLSPPITVPAGGRFEYAFHIPVIPVRLDAVTVTAEQRCRTRPGENQDTRLVWEEIEKALSAAAWVDRQEMLAYTWYRYDRELDRKREKIKSEEGYVGRGLSAQLFHSENAATLAAEGFILRRDGKIWYHMPDVQALMDDAFLSTHCFHVVRDTADARPRLGLAFEPAEDRELPDVRGVLWLDERTSQLLRLDASYTELPGGVDASDAGGSILFLMLPSGAWAIREWEIRAPRLRRGGVRFGARGVRAGRVTIAGYHDSGARILEATTRTGDVIYSAEFGHVSGIVFDSTRGAPLRDAVVRFAGTTLATATDSAGRFQSAVPLEGEYRIVVLHPWLDTIGTEVTSAPLQIAPGSVHTAVLSAPHVDSIAARRCGPVVLDPAYRLIHGTVWERGSGHAVADAAVTAEWFSLHWSEDNALGIRQMRLATEADPRGRYALCNVPTDQPVRLRAASPGGRWVATRIVARTEPDRPMLVGSSPEWTEPFERGPAVRYPSIRYDFTLDLGEGLQVPADATSLSGYVIDRLTREPLADVRVIVNDADTAQSRHDGTFGSGVTWRPATNRVRFERLGYQSLALDFAVRDTTLSLAVGLTLSPAAVELDPVEVVGEATDEHLRRAGFYERKRLGLGRFLGPEEIENRVHAARTWPELLVSMPGVVPVHFGMGPSFDPDVECKLPLVFVDGMRLLVDLPSDIYGSGAVSLDDIAAIEVYRRPSEIPAQYGGAESGCGVVLIWTKRRPPQPN